MKVNIDLDMVAHELGHLRRDTGDRDEDDNPIMELFDIDEVAPIAKGRVLSIVMGSGAGGWKGWLTGRGKQYRHKLATILPYKGHREGAERNNVDLLKDIFHHELGAEWCFDREADDALATEQWTDLVNVGSSMAWDDAILREHSNVVTATRDKDLNTVPGWKFRWWLKGTKDAEGNVIPEEKRQAEKGEIYWVSFVEALRNFYQQLLVGDSSDNIKGLYNIGPGSAWVKQLKDMHDEDDMFDHVEEKYRKYYGDYGDKFLIENARLLHMQRRIDDVWEPPHARDEHYWFL